MVTRESKQADDKGSGETERSAGPFSEMGKNLFQLNFIVNKYSVKKMGLYIRKL